MYLEKISQLEELGLMNAEFYFSIPSYVKEKDKSLKHLNQPVVFKQVRKEIIGLKLEEY